jgi:serine/threonine protein kinase
MIGEVLGKGAFSTVRLAVSKSTNKKWAGNDVIEVTVTSILCSCYVHVAVHVDDGKDGGYNEEKKENERIA